MRRIIALTIVLITGTSAFVWAGPAYSGKEMKAVQPVPPPCDWTGFYIGGHFGWRGGDATWLNAEDSDVPQEILNNDSTSGIFGGLQIGYNRQFGQWFVLGMELTGSYGGLDDTHVLTETDEVKRFDTENDWSGTFVLRAGFTTLNNKLLIYGKAGGAVTHWNYEYVNDESNTAGVPEFDTWSPDETRVSPVVGIGAEYMINCHWTLKLEYQHIFLGDATITSRLVEDREADDTEKKRIQLDQNSVQFGVNYKF